MKPLLKTDMEIVESNQLGESIASLQSLIERQANQLQEIKREMKLKREELKSVFDNDPLLADAQEAAKDVSNGIKEHKARVRKDPQVIALDSNIDELNEQKKDLEESLSGSLVSYHQITGSTSFDTSDGDQWDFKINAKVKPRQLKLFES